MTKHPPRPQWRARTVAIDDPGDLLDYLPADGYAWLRRGDGIVAIGEAARFDGGRFDEADRWWRELCEHIVAETELPDSWGSGPIALASFVFDPENTRHRSVMVVPRMVLGRRRGRSWLTVLSAPQEEPPPAPVRQDAPAAPGRVRVRGSSLDRSAWYDIVAQAVTGIRAKAVSKVVLARSEDLTAAGALDPRWPVRRLAGRYRDCWTFALDGLVGASPEMLVRREGGLVTSRVLAGTIRRSGEEELDLALAHALARSSKNLIEHELAVASVADAMGPFCSGMNVPDAPYVLELPNVLHLASDVTAVVHPDVSALRLAGELHPSAAVCGTPTPDARALIADLERLDRGRYSGPVGWLDAAGDGEFAIALRCGYIDPATPETITVYAGCGIVADSEPAQEYAETEAKLLPMHEALGLAEM